MADDRNGVDTSAQLEPGSMYEGQIAGNTTVNETQIRRAGRRLDDVRAAKAMDEGDFAAAGSVQSGMTAAERDVSTTNAARDDANNTDDKKSSSAKTTSSARGAQKR